MLGPGGEDGGGEAHRSRGAGGVGGRLLERRAAGELRSADVRAAAASLGIGERTLWGWLSAGAEAPRRKARARYEITQADRDGYAKWRGNVAALHRERLAARGEHGVPSLRRLQEAFARDMTPAERAAAVEGIEGQRRHQVYLRWGSGPAQRAVGI